MPAPGPPSDPDSGPFAGVQDGSGYEPGIDDDYDRGSGLDAFPDRERIRPAPRPVRAVPPCGLPAPVPVPVPVPVPAPPPVEPAAAAGTAPVPAGGEEEDASVFRPDRSRMAPISLDRTGARAQKRSHRSARKARDRDRRQAGLDRWFFRFVLALLTALLLLGIRWMLLPHFDPEAAAVSAAGSRKPVRPAPLVLGDSIGNTILKSSGEHTLSVLKEFMAAPDAAAKAAYVLDGPRVFPMMVRTYTGGGLPEAGLAFGVPILLEPGLTAVPARTTQPPILFFNLLFKDQDGQPRLDWETYEQELSGRFLAFAADPGHAGGDFRLVIERAHAFGDVSPDQLAVRAAPPGSPPLVRTILVSPEASATLASGLPWNLRRRALVKLAWETPADASPRLVLRELVRWDFLP